MQSPLDIPIGLSVARGCAGRELNRTRQSAGSAARFGSGWSLRHELPNRTEVVASAQICGAVEIAARVQHNVADRIGSIGAAGELVQVGVGKATAGAGQLEHAAKAVQAAGVRRAIQVSAGIRYTDSRRPSRR